VGACEAPVVVSSVVRERGGTSAGRRIPGVMDTKPWRAHCHARASTRVHQRRSRAPRSRTWPVARGDTWSTATSGSLPDYRPRPGGRANPESRESHLVSRVALQQGSVETGPMRGEPRYWGRNRASALGQTTQTRRRGHDQDGPRPGTGTRRRWSGRSCGPWWAPEKSCVAWCCVSAYRVSGELRTNRRSGLPLPALPPSAVPGGLDHPGFPRTAVGDRESARLLTGRPERVNQKNDRSQSIAVGPHAPSWRRLAACC
jgi:hypothetical protein